jgi:hypothetical protein
MTDEFAQFIRMVEQMREAQLAYFRTKGGLGECKQIERAVDRWLADYRERESGRGQSRLFGE